MSTTIIGFPRLGSTLTRRKSLPQATQDASQVSQTALQLYEELAEKEKGIRLLGITVTGF